MTTKPRCILFDNDGTLVDTQAIILASFHHALQTVLHKDFPDDVLMRKVGQPLSTQMWDFTQDEDTHDRLLEVYRAHNATILEEGIAPYAGIKEALEELTAAGIPLGVVTSKRHDVCLRGLKVLGLDQFFSLIIGSDDCETHKPDPGPVLMGCEAMGFAPSECWYVGDSPFDIQAGNQAGCATAAVLWGMFPEEVLRAEHPTVVLTHPSELLQLESCPERR